MKVHKGGCHCGRFQFEVSTDLAQVISCNCSICRKRGLLLTFVPVDQFRLISEDGQIADYLFGKKTIHHLFCPTCCIESFARGTAPDGFEIVAVNVRCLENVDIGALSPTPFDGRSL